MRAALIICLCLCVSCTETEDEPSRCLRVIEHIERANAVHVWNAVAWCRANRRGWRSRLRRTLKRVH